MDRRDEGGSLLLFYRVTMKPRHAQPTAARGITTPVAATPETTRCTRATRPRAHTELLLLVWVVSAGKNGPLRVCGCREDTFLGAARGTSRAANHTGGGEGVWWLYIGARPCVCVGDAFVAACGVVAQVVVV